MRTVSILNDGWKFRKTSEIPTIYPNNAEWESVTLPHTWNAKDGQDGGNDYWRGTTMYVKSFDRSTLPADCCTFLEINGAAMSASVYLNGKLLASHFGGYSTFRVDLTEDLMEENLLCIAVDNSENNTVYPQKADFTFYGGLYRSIKMICVPKIHFELVKDGTPGIKITPKIQGNAAEVTLEAWSNAPDNSKVVFQILPVSFESKEIEKYNFPITAQAEVCRGFARSVITIPHVHRWDGVNDPYLYTANASLYCDNELMDQINSRFGCRDFKIYPDKGFYLNGHPYPLRGVSRHQDRLGVGSAITAEMMREDMAVIKDIGANAVRLAHYQQAQEMYDLCDENGIIVWAEIPFITQFMPTGIENSISQMKELVTQCYNHPSVICWGLSNEITAASVVNQELIDNHKTLNNLCHQMDSTRPTVMAHAFMLEKESPLIPVADIASYNLYFGWYLGNLHQNDEFFDEYHKLFPDRVIGFSEYGADCNTQYHSNRPDRGDYTEEYQCLYHEHLLHMIEDRPFIWASFAWNLFDFAADGREEGGKSGQNQKGLIEFDHKTKKDAFYLYKAFWSKDPFVHICGKRYIDRPGNTTTIKVYSNLPSVTLYINDTKYGVQAINRIAEFIVPISGEQVFRVEAGKYSDSIRIRKVDVPNSSYSLPGAKSIINWFDKMDVDPDYFSIDDTIGEIRNNPEAEKLLEAIMAKAVTSRGDVAKASSNNPVLQQMIAKISLKELIKQAGSQVINEEQVKAINRSLQQIRK